MGLLQVAEYAPKLLLHWLLQRMRRCHLLVQRDKIVILRNVVLDGLHLGCPQFLLVLLPVLLGVTSLERTNAVALSCVPSG